MNTFTMIMRRLVPVLLVVLGAMAFVTSSASAAGTGFGFSFSFEAAGGFSNPVGLAVDQSNGDVYVADQPGNTLDKFSISGKAATQAWSVALPEVGGNVAQPNQLMVDENAGANKGYVYVAGVASNAVYRVNEAGTEVTEAIEGLQNPYEPGNPGYPTGVAVDAAGDFFVSLNGGAVVEFNEDWKPIDAEGTIVSEGDNVVVSGPGGPQTVIVSADGEYLYTPSGSGTIQYKLNGASYTESAVIDGAGSNGVTIDPSSGDIFVDQGGEVVEYPPGGGTPLAKFGPGTLSNGYGIGVYGKNVYVSDYNNKAVEVFEEGETPETPVTEPVTIEGAKATFNGELLGGESEYYFAYNSNGECGNGERTPAVTVEPAHEIEKVSHQVTELEVGTPYMVCLVAVNKYGEALGAPQPVEVKTVAPQVTTTQAGEVKPNRAQLNGELNPGGSAEYYFEYGPEPCTTATTPCTKTPTQGPVLHAAQLTAEAQIAGLISGQTYYYRLVAFNSAALTGVDGSEQTFTPENTPPVEVRTEPAEEVLESSAYLAGELNPGGKADYYFEYGTQPCAATSCGTKTPEEGPVVGEARKVVEAAYLTGLQPGTTYHYWIVVTNSHGSEHGKERSFTTPGSTVVITTPITGTSPIATGIVTNTTTSTTTPKTTTTTTKTTTVKPKPLTKAQKLAKALKQCKRDKKKSTRTSCEKQAHKRYPTTKSKKKGRSAMRPGSDAPRSAGGQLGTGGLVGRLPAVPATLRRRAGRGGPSQRLAPLLASRADAAVGVAVLGDELQLLHGDREEVQGYAQIVGDLDQLVLAVVADDGAHGTGGPLADPSVLVGVAGQDLVLVDWPAQSDDVVFADCVLDGAHGPSSLGLGIGADKAGWRVRVGDLPHGTDREDAVALLAQSVNRHVEDAVDAVGGVVADGSNRRDLSAIEDHGFEVVDVLDRDPEDTLEAPGLRTAFLVSHVQGVCLELVAHAEGLRGTRKQRAHLRAVRVGAHRFRPVRCMSRTLLTPWDGRRDRASSRPTRDQAWEIPLAPTTLEAGLAPTPTRDHQQRWRRLRGITTSKFRHALAGKQARRGDHPAELRSLMEATPFPSHDPRPRGAPVKPSRCSSTTSPSATSEGGAKCPVCT